MKCSAARALIDQRQNANDVSRQLDDLTFHIASCSDCRAYRAAHLPAVLDDATFLQRLFDEPSLVEYKEPAVISRPVVTHRAAIQAPFQRFAPSWRSLFKFIIITITTIVVLIIGGLAGALAMIHNNMQALIVTPTALLSAQMRPTAASVSARAAQATIVPTMRPSPMPQFAGRAPVLPTLLPTTKLPYPPQSKAINVLLLGSDLRPDETGNARTDTILVVRIDPEHQRIALLSLPRDLIVSIPGHGQARINSANAVGGIDLVRQTVSNLLDIPIDYYATINFDGFIAVVDAVGGIDIDIPTELYDPAFPTLDYGYIEAHFLPGKQHMDGATALMYSRIRHPDSDYDRIKRQQQVLLAIGIRLQQENVLQSIQRLVSITGALRGYVQTDMPEDTMLGLGWSVRSLSPSTVERYTLGANQVNEGVIAGDPYASFAVPGAIEDLVREFIGS